MNGTITVLNNSSFTLQLRFIEVDTSEMATVNIPSSPNVQEISISKTKSTDASTVQLILILRNPLTMYVDNCHLIIQ